MATVIFVHGTGVREEAYRDSLQQVGQRVLAARSDFTVMPCFWGEKHGAVLGKDGASIPEYDSTRAPGALLDEDYEVTLWALLYDDPLYEVRMLSLQTGQPSMAPPNKESPYQLLDKRLQQLVRGGTKDQEALDHEQRKDLKQKIEDQLRECRVLEQWSEAIQQVRGSGEYSRALQNAPAASGEYRLAIARSLVAQVILLHRQNRPETETLWMTGTERDRLVELIMEWLGDHDRGAFTWVKNHLVRLGLKYVTSRVQRKRGAVSDATYPASGDILLYQARGEAIRDFIRKTIQKASPPVVLLAHSLGGIASVDLLILEALPSVELLVTVGSQASFLYEINALSSLRFGNPLPPHFPKNWLNIYDLRDFLSYVAKDVFPGNVNIMDVKVDNRQPFPQSHSAYWSSATVWQEITKRIP